MGDQRDALNRLLSDGLRATGEFTHTGIRREFLKNDTMRKQVLGSFCDRYGKDAVIVTGSREKFADLEFDRFEGDIGLWVVAIKVEPANA